MRIYYRAVALSLGLLVSHACSVDDEGLVYGQGGDGQTAGTGLAGGNAGSAQGGRASGGRGSTSANGGGAGDDASSGGAGPTDAVGGVGGEAREGGDAGASAETGGAPESGLRARGEACSDDGECDSTFCRDGVCCETECTGECQSCAAPDTGAANGTCAPSSAGTDPRDECDASTPESCGNDGECDGEGACRNYGPSQVCAAAICAGASFTPAATCDGAGECETGAAQACGEFPCSDEGCQTPCTDDDDCPSASRCDNEVCRTCPTGNKVCDGACIPVDDCCGGCSGNRPVCEDATCVARENGDGCDTGAECASGNCVDGFCCNSACTGQCQSCSLTPGTCVAAMAPRMPCNGSGTCAGRCNGSSPSCVYPGAETNCAAAACTNGMASVAASCGGSGTCATSAPTNCPFGCKSGNVTCNQCRQKSSSNLLQNPGFDQNATGWISVGGAAHQPTVDAENCGASGSVLIETLAHEITQCRPASPDTFYSFGFRFRGTGPGSEPSSFCAMIFYKGSGCSTSSATSNIVTVTALGNLTSWVQGTGTGQSPPDAGSVIIDCAGQGGFGYYDQFYLSTTNATF
jgi:hypothetical protein